jgi:hypothetical protein
VLPNGVKQRLVNELDKRLDLDIDNVMESPKLRLQLSPAELDKRLLNLYNTIIQGPGGDVLRVIASGQEVALQDLYLKTHALRERARNPRNQTLSFGPFATLGEESEDGKRTASQWVNSALRRNLPTSDSPILRSDQKDLPARPEVDEKNQEMKMSLSSSSSVASRSTTLVPRIPFTTGKQFCPPRKSSSSYSLLI